MNCRISYVGFPEYLRHKISTNRLLSVFKNQFDVYFRFGKTRGHSTDLLLIKIFKLIVSQALKYIQYCCL